ncbi:MAG: heparinase II/III family protein [Nibricoccus sp.]
MRFCFLLTALGLALLSLSASSLRSAPAPEQAFADLKVYSPDGHPWRVPIEDWEGARQRVAKDPSWAAWLKREKSTIDDWMAKRRDRVEWVCGWYHDFVSPKDASHLIWTPDVPGEAVPFLSSPSDPKVEITPKIMGGWVFAFRSRHAEMMERAAFLYRLTGEEKYASWAAAQLDFYANHYLDWKPQRKDQAARLYWQTLDEATGGIKYINTVRLLETYPDAARKQLWWDKFFKPEAEVLQKGFRMIHNIANWHRCAVAQFALVYGDEALWREAIDGPFGLREQIAKGITADYLWFEQSFHYNEFVVQALVSLFTQAGLAGRASSLAHEMAVGENLMLAPLYLRFPDGQLPNPADGTGIETVPHRSFIASTYRVFPTTLGLAAATSDRNWNTLLDPPAAAPRSDALPTVVSSNLENSRMALLKQGRWQVFLHYGQLNRSHAQAEALNFSAFFDGTDITHDPGTVGYGSPYHKEYYSKGLNHNVPLVNGEGSVPPQPGELLEFSAEKGHVAAAQPKYRPDATAKRSLQIDGERLIDVATVHSNSKSPQALGLALHLQGHATLPATFVPDEKFAENRPPAFKYWQQVTKAAGKGQVSFDVKFGETTLRVTIAVPSEFTIWHGSSPDVPPKRREAFYVETHGTETTFTTTFEPVATK